MLDLLIHTTDTTYLNRDLKRFDDKYDRESCMKQGYLQRVMPTGHKWGKLELDRKRFIIVQIEDRAFRKEWLEQEYDLAGNEVCNRKYRFPLAKILSLGELESLKNITYNSKEKLSPIIKTADLATIVEINNWDKQPTTIKLHGSAGDFEIIQNGAGDYTSLKTAVESEAADISGGAVDANFYISGAWTASNTGNFDIDGWTMGSNKMLIQTQGDARSSDGTYDTTAYRIVDHTQGFDIECANVTIDGVQVNSGIVGIEHSAGSDTSAIKNCIITGTLTNYGIVYIAAIRSTSTNLIENCVIYKTKISETSSEGILNSDQNTTVNVINSIVSGFDDGIELDYGTMTVKNCAVFNNNHDFDGAMLITYTASDDNPAGTGNVDISPGSTESTEWAKAFTDYANGDFSIKGVDSVLYDSGDGNTGTDITGYTWTTDDIGALAWQVSATPTAALTGTASDGATEAEIKAGGQTIVITLTDDTWVATVGADNAITTALIAGIDSGQAEAAGWDAVVKANMVFGDVARTSPTVVTITLAEESTYAITANETITVTIPVSALTAATEVVATPTFVITATASPIKSINGVLRANIASVNGVALSNINKINGV